MTDKLAELRALEEAATPRWWAPVTCYSLVTNDRSSLTHGTSDANRALIAAMRNALPALLDVADAARVIAHTTDRENARQWWEALLTALARLEQS